MKFFGEITTSIFFEGWLEVFNQPTINALYCGSEGIYLSCLIVELELILAQEPQIE